MLHGPRPTQRFAKKLRRAMTLPEVLLWQVLRTRPGGLRVGRQHPAGSYVLDFYCPVRRLAVEVDGEAHNRGDRPARDAERDTWLKGHGVVAVRVAASDALGDPDAVVRYIVAVGLPQDSYPSTAFGGPPPPPGKD